MQTTLPIRLVFIEDHVLFAEGLKAMLTETLQFEVCAISHSIKDGLNKLTEIEADILLLDVALPDGNGLQLLPLLKELKPNLKVVILSMYHDQTYLKIAQKKGTYGYFPKNIALQQLVVHLKEIFEGKKVFFRNALTIIKDVNCKLTVKEMEVLNFLKFGKSASEIASITNTSLETVKTHKKNMLKKTDTHSVIQMLEKAKSLGWMV